MGPSSTVARSIGLGTAAACVVLLITLELTPQWIATTRVAVNESPPVGNTWSLIASLGGGPVPTGLLLLPVSVSARTAVAERAAGDVHGITAARVLATTTVSDSARAVEFAQFSAPTRTLTVVSRETTRSLARAVSAAYTRELVSWRDRVVVGRLTSLDSALAFRQAVHAPLAGVDLTAARAELQTMAGLEAARLRLATATVTNEVPVRSTRDTIVGFLAFAIGGAALALVRQFQGAGFSGRHLG